MSASSTTSIPYVDIEIDTSNVNDGAKIIVKHLRPMWDQDALKVKVFTGGISNQLVGISETSNPSDVILVRVYGANTELMIDRAAENRFMEILHMADCGPPLYCTFKNGCSYGFVSGETLDEELIRDDKVKRLIAQEMVRFHSIPPSSDNEPKPCAFLFPKFDLFLDIFPTEFKDSSLQSRFENDIPSRLILIAEITMLRSHLEPLSSPVVLSHNDLLIKNIIYNKHEEKVSFIDFEYAAYNYQAHDIGNHFCEYAGVDTVDFSRYPSREYQLDWLRAYLQFWNQHNSISQPVTDQQVELLYVQVNKFALAAHFFWGLWAVIQAKHSLIDFDFMGYGCLRFSEYFKRKDEFLALKA